VLTTDFRSEVAPAVSAGITHVALKLTGLYAEMSL
jgi:hypothetical protein